MSNFGEYIKLLRESKNLTLREVERQTDVSNAYLSQLESNKVKQPSPVTLYKLAELYGVKYEDLMEKVGYPIPSSTSGDAGIKKNSIQISERFGKITRDEEVELLGYLKFIRNRKK
jgi:transcriptional regulator with XRE-family HTH domain